MELLRASVNAMVGYQPGEQPKANSPVIKLNTNENPYPPSPKAVQAILTELEQGGARLRLYSDPSASELRLAASQVFQLPVENILHGNGSDELLALLFRAFLEPGDRIAHPYPTYVLYRTLAATTGAAVDNHPFDESYALPRSLFGNPAKLTFVASPNSPSGTHYQTAELRELARSLTRGILVVDEAYAAFADEHALTLALSEPNVVVLRTFSKSHSLAGMRIGLAFASEPIIQGLNKVKDSYNLDRLAIAAGAASLLDEAWTAQNTQRIIQSREQLTSRLSQLGFQVTPSQANFLLVKPPARSGGEAQTPAERARDLFQYLKQHGILIRYFSEPGLDDALRISIGTEAEMQRLVEVVQAWLKG